MDETIGDRLKKAREWAGLTIADAAHALGAHWHVIQRYEEAGGGLGGERLLRLSRLYDIPPGYIQGGDDAIVERNRPAFEAVKRGPFGPSLTEEEEVRMLHMDQFIAPDEDWLTGWLAKHRRERKSRGAAQPSAAAVSRTEEKLASAKLRGGRAKAR